MTKAEYIKLVNDTRKASKNKWYSFTEIVTLDSGYTVKVGIKGFGAGIQRMEISDNYNMMKDGSYMDGTVKQFNEFLSGMLDQAETRFK